MAVEPITLEECQKRAKQWRDMARAERDPITRKEFDDLAAAWEQLCEEMEARAK